MIEFKSIPITPTISDIKDCSKLEDLSELDIAAEKADVELASIFERDTVTLKETFHKYEESSMRRLAVTF